MSELRVFPRCLLCKQRPASQLMGTFLAAALPRIPALSAAQLVGCLEAMAALQLSREDTQVYYAGINNLHGLVFDTHGFLAA